MSVGLIVGMQALEATITVTCITIYIQNPFSKPGCIEIVGFFIIRNLFTNGFNSRNGFLNGIPMIGLFYGYVELKNQKNLALNSAARRRVLYKEYPYFPN